MILNQAKKYITSGELDEKLSKLYGEDKILFARARYLGAIGEFERLYGGDRDIEIFSVPGRSELSGNHTDHNCGRVIAASVDLDIIAVASACAGSVVRFASEGYPESCVDFDVYSFPNTEHHGSTTAIIAGVLSGMNAGGYRIGGFDAYSTSNVLAGSGLSSSAAFENTVGTIINHLYNDGKIDGVTIAQISQYAENEFFGKPCGLMDQIACSVGGAVTIDFADPKTPVVEKLDNEIFDGYTLCIVNTGGSHADLTDDYAAVPSEMKSVAAHFGKKNLRELTKEEVIADIPSLRTEVGDRAIMRAIHFFNENDRVKAQVEAIRTKDLDAFFRGVLSSGRSSFCYLQNVFTPKNPSEQGVSLALCIAENHLKTKKAAWRVHGGGFAGTIQAFVPTHHANGFAAVMDEAFGIGACHKLRIRNTGAERII